MQGRPRQSTKLLELKGAFKKNPARARERAQEGRDDRGVGDPPAEFLNPHSPTSIAQLAIWNRLLEEAPPGCIMRRHRTDLTNACRLQYQMEHGKATPAMHQMMHRYLTSFGMTGEGRLSGQGGKGDVPPGESEESGWQAFRRQEKAARVG